jgi:hypothetical protein
MVPSAPPVTNKSTLATVPVDVAGHATFTSSTVPAGAITVHATYNGDGNFLTSSGTTVQTVGSKAPSTTTLSSSRNPAVFGAAVTFMATVTGSGNTPSGTVSFIDSKLTLATVSLNASGVATFTISNLSIGTHNMHAQYNGSSQYNTSSSNVISQTITASTSSTFVTSQASMSPNPTLFNILVGPALPIPSRMSQQTMCRVAVPYSAAAVDRLAVSGLYASKVVNALPFPDSLLLRDLSVVDRIFSDL